METSVQGTVGNGNKRGLFLWSRSNCTSIGRPASKFTCMFKENPGIFRTSRQLAVPRLISDTNKNWQYHSGIIKLKRVIPIPMKRWGSVYLYYKIAGRLEQYQRSLLPVQWIRMVFIPISRFFRLVFNSVLHMASLVFFMNLKVPGSGPNIWMRYSDHTST